MRKAVLLLLFAACSALAQVPYLVEDINTTFSYRQGSSTPYGFTAYRGRIYFSASTPESGRELWSMDATSGGATLVADIVPGSGSSNPDQPIVLNGLLLFRATSLDHGSELWVSDGTAAGTRELVDLNAGPPSSDPIVRFPLADGKRMLFRANDGRVGPELWITDGTAEGTRLLKDLGDGWSAPAYFTSFGGGVYFATTTELWKTDGSDSGTVKVASVRARNLVAAGPRLFFDGYSVESGWEPWVTDGSEGGTRMIADLLPGPQGSLDAPFYEPGVALGDLIVFAATDALRGRELWISDGTAEGTRVLRDFVPGAVGTWDSSTLRVTVLGSRAYFAAPDAAHGQELWSTDGTESGTTLFRDLAPGPRSSHPSAMVVLGGRIVFTARSTPARLQLWSTDGTAAGTHVITPPAAAGLEMALPQVVDGRIYFSGGDRLHGHEPWVTDGTPHGTRLLANLVKDGAPSALPAQLTAANGLLFFYALAGAASPITDSDAYSLWRSDGTAEGTYPVRDVVSPPNPLVATPSGVVFIDRRTDAIGFVSDGTVDGTTAIPSLAWRFGRGATLFDLWAVGGRLFASAGTFYDRELWVTTAEANAPAIRLGVFSPSKPFEFAGRTLLLASRDRTASGSRALWTTDGTPAGTRMILPDLGGSSVLLATAAGSLFVSTSIDRSQSVLSKSDGTLHGTTVVRQVPLVTQMKGAGRKLFFVAGATVANRALWAGDGTAAGTIELKKFELYESDREELLAVGDRIVFPQYRREGGKETYELWGSDGTAGGTRMLVANGAFHPWPVNVDGVVYFSGYDPVHGAELWSTDGTPEGTERLADINAGPESSMPYGFTRVGATLYFAADTASTGRELWALPLTEGRLSIDDARAAEGGTVRFTIALNFASRHAVSVAWATKDGSARAGEDYDAAGGTVTFAPGETRRTIEVRLRGDATFESNETFFVALSDPRGASFANAEGAGLIEDDDESADVSVGVAFREQSGALATSVTVSNAGPTTAANVEVRLTAVPNFGADCTSCRVPQLRPGQVHAVVFAGASRGQQVVRSAVVSARPADPQTANNAVTWSVDGSSTVAMTPAFLVAGGTGSVVAVADAETMSVTSSNPSVVAVPSSVARGDDRTARFTITALAPGSAIVSIGSPARTLLVHVVAAGTAPRLPNALNIARNMGTRRLDQPLGVVVTPSGQAPGTGAAPTGTVTVTAGGVELVRRTLTGGSAPITLLLYFRAPGPATYTVAYSGDENFLPQSVTYENYIYPGQVSITGGLTAKSGGTFQLDVEVEGSPVVTPTGTIVVTHDGAEIARGTLLPASGGKAAATFTLANLPASPTVTVTYSGDAAYAGSSQQMRVVTARRRGARH